MIKVYIAGRYSRRDEFRDTVLPKLEAEGFKTTSRWLQETANPNSGMGDHSDEFYTETALIDLEDIDSALFVLFFAEDPLVGVPRGGRHVEFGYALAQGKPIAVIGPKENVFHYVPEPRGFIKHFKDVDEFIAVLNQKRKEYNV